MKSLLCILALFSLQAFACPDFTGTYKCTVDGKDAPNVTVSQSVKDGITFFDFGGGAVPAFGQEVPVPDSDGLKGATFKGSCDADTAFTVEVKGRSYQENAYYGDLDVKIVYTKGTDSFKQVQTSTMTNHGGIFKLPGGEQDCTKIP